MGGAGELRSDFASTTGGVMTVEAGAITGELELLTRPTASSKGIEALVRYAGASELYTVAGSPVGMLTASTATDAGEHLQAHDAILAHLTTPGTVSNAGNEQPVDLRGA
jgi:hypothetical protein